VAYGCWPLARVGEDSRLRRGEARGAARNRSFPSLSAAAMLRRLIASLPCLNSWQWFQSGAFIVAPTHRGPRTLNSRGSRPCGD
jgi:hypothetical protein